MPDKVRIYTVPSCKYCEEAKEYLSRKGIGYTELDVKDNEDAALEMFDISGEVTPPVIKVGNTVIVGFDPLSLDEVFSVSI